MWERRRGRRLVFLVAIALLVLLLFRRCARRRRRRLLHATPSPILRKGESSTAAVSKTAIRRSCAEAEQHADTLLAHESVYTGPIRRDESVFVSIASYRDVECSRTLRDLYARARRPERVFVGVVAQNHPKHPEEDPDPARWISPQRQNQIRVLRMSHQEARGPCFARYLCAKLHRGETYYLQIDSHTRFVQDWDEILIDMLREKSRDGQDKVVLTHYPQSWENMQSHTVPVNDRAVAFADRDYFKYRAYNRTRNGDYRESLGVAGGLLFAPSEMLAECPLDPRLNMVFHGEEYLYSTRLYTYGWKFYAPKDNVVYHYYYRRDAPKFYTDAQKTSSRRTAQAIAPRIVEHLLRTEPYPYFGTVHSTDAYRRFCASRRDAR